MNGDRISHEDLVGVWLPRWAVLECEGDIRDAVVYAQVTYWLQPSQKDGSPRTTQMVERDGYCWLYLTDAELGEEIGVDKGTVYRARRSLQKRGLVDSRRAQVGGQMVTLVRLPGYRENATPCRENALPVSRKRDSLLLTERVGSSFVESASAASPSESKKVDYDGSGDPPSVETVRLKRLPFPPQFAECWNLYPKRCDHDKLGAYKAWRARVVEAPKAGVGRPERMGNLLWAVRGYVLDCEEEDRAEEFMKNASTFFGAANESVMKYCARVARQRYADPDEPEVEVREPVQARVPLSVVGAGTGPPGRNGASAGHAAPAEGTAS